MFLVKVECKNVSVEKLAEILLIFAKWFRIWLYKKKVYASFMIETLTLLESFTNTLQIKKIKFRFYRIEEIDYEK